MAKEIRVNKLYQGYEKEKLIKVEINSKNVLGKVLYAILEIPRNAEKKVIKNKKDKVEKLLSELRGEITEKQESPKFSWLKKIGIAAVISLSITILVSVAMKISAHRKRRNTQ